MSPFASITQSAPPSDWVERAERVLAPTYARPARVFVSGEGSTLVDEDGRAGLLDVLLVSAAVLVSVLVVNALLADAGWPGLSQ